MEITNVSASIQLSLENNRNLMRRNPRGYFAGNGHLTKYTPLKNLSDEEVARLTKSDKRRRRKLLFAYLTFMVVISAFVTYLTLAVGYQ